MRVMVAGSGRLGAGIIHAIEASEHHEVVALVQDARDTSPLSRRMGRAWARILGGPANAIYVANRHRIPLVDINGSREEDLAPLRPFQPDIFLTCGFSVILKKPLLEFPKVAPINVHSSLLPDHRGPMPFSAVILAGAEESGVTFHLMDEGIDTGPILERYAFPLEESDTAVTVYKKAADVAAENVVAVLDRVASEGIGFAEPQDLNAGSYDKKFTPDTAYLDWNRPAVELERMVRAGFPFCLAHLKYKGRTVFVTRARYTTDPVVAEPGKVLQNRPFVQIATGQGTFTPLTSYHSLPYPFIWPNPFSPPKIGSVLPSPANKTAAGTQDGENG